MAVDKKLFMYDLAVVAIMKNEAPYLKEWLDYHLLAGVDHFYIYDNDSSDNIKEILEPYIERGIVTYIFYPGKAMQMQAYNEAIRNFKFFCRYIAFIDADEFIFPKSGETIMEIVDEILSENSSAAGLAVNWQMFGSNGEETADYSRGVLERFPRRAQSDYVEYNLEGGIKFPDGNAHVKTIADPRKINFFANPHFPQYFEDSYSVNEEGTPTASYYNDPVTAEKIVVNHYHAKSLEEYKIKIERGNADAPVSLYKLETFHKHDRNEVFDDGILKYRESRQHLLEEIISTKKANLTKIFNDLLSEISPIFSKNTSDKFFAGKLETFLTCRAIVSHLRENSFDEFAADFFEELSLRAANRAMHSTIGFSDVRLLLKEMPIILPLKYPVVDEIRKNSITLCSQVLELLKNEIRWQPFAEVEFILKMLESFGEREQD